MRTKDQHVLGHPALLVAQKAGHSKRKALLSQKRVSTVARTEGPDRVIKREVADVPSVRIDVTK